MDVGKMIEALRRERESIDEIIQALQRLVDHGATVTASHRRGRKFMDKAGRREVSERMKRYWENKREQERLLAPQDSNPKAPQDIAGSRGPAPKKWLSNKNSASQSAC